MIHVEKNNFIIVETKTIHVSLSLLILPVLFWIALFKKFPNMVAAHYDSNNNVDGYENPNFVLLILTAINIIIFVLLYFISLIALQEVGKRRSINLVRVLLNFIIAAITINEIITYCLN